MEEYKIKEYKYRGYKIIVYVDPNPPDPREKILRKLL